MIVLLMALVLLGCEKKEEDFSDQTYEDLEDVFDFFATPQYEDLEFYDEGGTMEGTSNVLMYDEETINLIMIENNIAFTLSIYITEDSNRKQLVISEIDIMYIDFKNEIYIELWFYKDNLLDIAENMTLKRNVIDFNRGLRQLTIKDYQDLLDGLGYREAKTQEV